MFTASCAVVVSSPAKAADAESSSFYARWPYVEPADLLPFVRASATRGDSASVLAALDEFATHYPNYSVGKEKAVLLTAVLRDVQPHRALEVGTFIGYSAIVTALELRRRPGARLTCVEASAANAAVARELLDFAAVGDIVEIKLGLSSALLPSVARALGGPADYVFLDHAKDCYLPDLKALESLGVVAKGTVVVADNVIYPSAPGAYMPWRARTFQPLTCRISKGYLEHVATESGRYTTRLLDAAFEYNRVWEKGWEPTADALSVSTKL